MKDNSRWADAVLGQCFRMPKSQRKELLSGAVEWQIKNNTLIITPLESQ